MEPFVCLGRASVMRSKAALVLVLLCGLSQPVAARPGSGSADDVRPLAADAGADERMFRQAYDLGAAGKEAESEALYQRLFAEYPGSRFVPDALLTLAETRFNRGDIDAALEIYRRIEAFPNVPVFPYSVYKQGWCWMNKGDYAQAQATFARVIGLAGKPPTAPAQREALGEQAKKDFARAYARTGAPDRAAELFQRVGGSAAPKMLETLGDAYYEQGRWGDSAATYRELIAADVGSPRICDWQDHIVKAALASGAKKDQVAEVQRLGAVYQRLARTAGVPAADLAACRQRYHDTTKELALLFHKEAQKTQDPATYQLTDPLYREYLSHFEKDKDAYSMAFYYGELLFKLERWEQAADQYTHVVEMEPAGKYVKEAAYAAVIASKNAWAGDESPLGGAVESARNTGLKLGQLSKREQKLMGAFDAYLRIVPDAPETPVILYRKARIHYEHSQWEKAAPLFLDVVNKYPGSELAVYAINLYLDSLNMQHKTREVCDAVDRFLKGGPATKDAELGKQLRALRADCDKVAKRALAPPGPSR